MSSLELVISLRYDTPETTTTRAPGALQRWPSILTSIAPGFDRFAFAFTVNQLRARSLGVDAVRTISNAKSHSG